MAALVNNLFKYYSKPPTSSAKEESEPKDTEIKVISEEEAKKPPAAAPIPPPHKKGPLVTGKRIILAVILFLIAIDIPVGLRLVQQYRDNRTTASIPSPTTQPQALIAPSPTTIPSPLPPSPTSPITPISLITPIITNTPAPTTSFGTTELAEPTLNPVEELAEASVQTHAECFNGACIEIEGAGVDQCIIDDDCLQPSPTEIPELADSISTPIPVPDTPAAGSITNTILGILSGVGILLLALLL